MGIARRGATNCLDGSTGLWRPLGCAAVLVALATPLIARAQFQEPTKEELQMTADPKAPGAAAVYLYYEEITDSRAHTSSFYERIKILAEKGKELATVTMPYEPSIDKIADIEGRTIHADGTVIPMTAKASDLIDVKAKGFQVDSIVFTLPSVEVGSILEYRLTTKRDEDWAYSPTWEIQKQYFVHKAHYSFRPGSFINMLYATYIGSGEEVVSDKHDVFTLDIADVPPEPDEDWMPPINTVRWRVQFYSTVFRSDTAFWSSAMLGWAGWVGDFIKPSGKLTDAARGLVAPGDSDRQKAEKIYAAVMKLDNTDFTRKKSKAERKKEKLKEIKKTEDVWKQQSGSADEIALLYVSLARAVGLKAWPMRVVDRSHANFDRSFLSSYQLDDYIAVVALDGKDIYLDPGQKMCPFGSMHWKHSLATGFRLTDNGAVIATTTGLTYLSSLEERVASLSIDETGNVTGTIRFILNGPDALYWRQIALENDADEVKKRFNETMHDIIPDGVEAEFDHFLGLDDYESNLIGIVKVSGTWEPRPGSTLSCRGYFWSLMPNIRL